MATPAKPWKAEYAKSSRASCKSCKSPIAKDALRLGKMVQSSHFDGLMPLWNHASCIFKRANQIKSIEDIEGLDLLRWDDQQKIRKYLEEGTQEETLIAEKESSIEISPSSRTSCKNCNDKIVKGAVRVSTKPDEQGSKGLIYYHINCFIDTFPSSKIERLLGWADLPISNKEEISVFVDDHKDIEKKGAKRRKTVNDDNGGKASRTEERVAPRSSSDLEKKLEEQSNELWAIKDGLKKHVSNSELREMLEVNGQDSAGSEYDLRERCADGMLFGALTKCPLCDGSLYYSNGQYHCHGYISAWSKCSYVTSQPIRLKSKWKVLEGTDNQFLLKWFKTQKAKKSERVLPLVPEVSPEMPNLNESGNLKVALYGKLKQNKDDWKRKLSGLGGEVLPRVGKGITCLVVGGEVDDSDPEIKRARRMKVPTVREEYLSDCIDQKKRLPLDAYKIYSEKESLNSGTLTVKVKGRSSVHESSGLQDTCHILEDGKSIYNTTLNMSDLSTGINSYYILQIIEEDKGHECYVFRKWGRVGNEKIGGKKLEQMPKSEAIDEFKCLFLEKTGNSWEIWEQEKDFVKQPGRFFPLDIDYGVKQAPKRKNPNTTSSMLPPQLAALMRMLFDVETYRAVMMEFEINMSEMPLGKLSKKNIQKGFEALTEIQNLLTNAQNVDPSIMKSLIVDASNRFFTLIPSVHPHAIMDLEDFKSKVKMLDALQDIEIASRLVGFDDEDGETLDDKYKKLRCNICPLDHHSEDYKLVEKYLLNTHAPTHKDWKLELEDVFALERESEGDRYTSFRNGLRNKMLLWHGSRVTNFVGILSQGLRIAPPEAPTTGYMFGKGVYFADLVSKSAQYCFVDKKNPVGLLLLSEVALGEMYELKKATYMERPPEGKNSTKGLGKTVPESSEFVRWRDQIVVPCGKPVRSSVQASELLYNEYIVYNTAQVKMQFLVKVRFHHKR